MQQIWRAAIPAAVFLIGDGGSRVIVLPLLAAAVVLLALIAFVAWTRFTYELADDALVVEWGVLNRQRREVPLTRIQQVDVRRSFVQRLFGLSALHVDTASSGSGSEVVLASLAEGDAIALHDLLLARRHAAPAAAGGDGTVPAAAGAWTGPHLAPARPLVRLGTGDLALAAVTGPALGVGLGLGVAFLTTLGDGLFGGRSVGSGVAAVIGVGVLGLVGLAFVTGAAIVTTVLANNDFTLARQGNDLRVRRGLLDQRETTLALHRVQCVRVSDNPARRRLGRCAVELQSGGGGGSTGGTEQASLDSTRVTIPLLHRNDLPALLALVLPDGAELPPIEPAPPVARRRRLTRAAAGSAIVLALALLLTLAEGLWGLLVLAGIGAAVMFALVGPAYRGLGSGLGDDLVVARSGTLHRVTVLVPMARLQSVAIERSPLQARVGIGTLRLDVAGRGRVPRVIDGAEVRLREIRAAALFDDSTRADERRARARTRRAARDEASTRPVG